MKTNNRIDRTFQNLRKTRKKAVILFVTAGDPSLEVTRQFLRFAQTAGVDIVELGVPFSDPIADGPVIQASSFRALGRGVNLEAILRLVREERGRGFTLPVVLMTSYNPVFHYGVRKALTAAKISGVDGFVVPDLPVHEAGEFIAASADYGLHNILMTTPTTSPERKRAILKKAGGFIYYVSLTGLTGERKRNRYAFKGEVEKLRRATSVPVCVGFGISTPEQAGDIAAFSDGAIIGSALVRDLEAHSKKTLSERSKKLVRSFVNGVKAPK